MNNDTSGGSVLPFSSNINWAQLVGLAATLLTLFGVDLDKQTQAAIVSVIVGLTAIATWVLHTFVNHPNNVAAARTLIASAASASKKVAPVLLVALISLPVLLTLSACETLGSAAVSLTGTSAGEAHAVAAAENLYTVLDYAALAYIKSGKATPATIATIKQDDNEAYAAVVAAREASAAGNSGSIAAALTLLTAKNQALSDFLAAKTATP